MAKAVRFDHYGGRDVLYLAEVEVPHPADGEVVVRVKVAGVNPGEAAIREGRLHERYPATFPSGRVVTSLASCTKWARASCRGQPATRSSAGHTTGLATPST
jgi:hypothetical protein